MPSLSKSKKALLGLLVVLAGGLYATHHQWAWFLADHEHVTEGVNAPTLEVTNEETERLYRIEPNTGSTATYSVDERLVGRDTTAVGTTDVLGGDIVINLADPSASVIGDIVVNVEAMESDSAMRDKRLRHDYLESGHHPFVTFVTESIEGLPDLITDGTSAEVTLTGQMTVKETTSTESFTGTLTIDGEALTGTLTSTILLSTYDAGPIKISGFASSGDEVVLTLEVDAKRVVDTSSVAAGLDSNLVPISIGDGSFSTTVQPVLEARCVSCHVEGGPGASTWELSTAGQAAEVAQDIALVTSAGYMPPWPASTEGPEFKHNYSLDPEELDAILAWASSGGGLDIDPDTELVASANPIREIPRDIETSPSEAYVGDTSVSDDYRCLVHEIPDPDNNGTWVAGLSFEPDELEIVHHSIMYRVPAAAREEVTALDGADGRPGWTCYGLSGLTTEGVSSIGGWVPGQQPRVYPEGVGLRFEPGDFIVNQIHYHFDEINPPDQSTIVMDVVEDSDLASGMRPIAGSSYLTPAEGPCLPDEEGPLCDRSAMIRLVDEKYGGVAPFIPDALIANCGGTVDDYDDLDGSQFSSSCDLPARNAGTIFSLLGHMHEFGEAYRMTLNPGTPQEQILLDIPKWSFDWQLYYEPVEPIRIEEGDTIRFECTWDRTNVAMEEPRYIIWNEGTFDEMCFSTVNVIPDP